MVSAAADTWRALPRWVRDSLSCLAWIAFAAVVLYLLDAGCLFRFMTGIPCPGCGMTRAWLAALRLDFAQAFAYHPLFWTVPVAFALAVAQPRVRGRWRKAANAAMVVLLAVLLVLWFVRLTDSADAGLLFGGDAPQGMPADIIHIVSPAWLLR